MGGGRFVLAAAVAAAVLALVCCGTQFGERCQASGITRWWGRVDGSRREWLLRPGAGRECERYEQREGRCVVFHLLWYIRRSCQRGGYRSEERRVGKECRYRCSPH